KLGLLALLNEESHFPKATDDTLLEKLHGQHSVAVALAPPPPPGALAHAVAASCPCRKTPSTSSRAWPCTTSACDITPARAESSGLLLCFVTAAPCWCVQVVYDVRGMLQKNRDPSGTTLDFVYDLFEHLHSRSHREALKSSSKHRRPTVVSQFKVRTGPVGGAGATATRHRRNRLCPCCRTLSTR
ncbi:unnamed protein product, partial [Tetraodon nigroviridis]